MIDNWHGISASLICYHWWLQLKSFECLWHWCHLLACRANALQQRVVHKPYYECGYCCIMLHRFPNPTTYREATFLEKMFQDRLQDRLLKFAEILKWSPITVRRFRQNKLTTFKGRKFNLVRRVNRTTTFKGKTSAMAMDFGCGSALAVSM